MGFTDQIGQSNLSAGASPAMLGNIELGIGASINPSTQAPLFLGVVQNRFLTAKVVQRATSQLDTEPKNYDIAVTETKYPYVVDVSNYLSGADVVSGVSAAMTLTSTGATLASSWQVSITTLGNVITIIIDGSKLRYGQIYQIAVTFTASSSKVATYISTLTVVA